MFDAGSMLILFALALMMVSPIHLTIMRPRTSITQVAPMLRGSFLPPVPVPDIDALVRLTDDAPAHDPLIRATVAITETHNQP